MKGPRHWDGGIPWKPKVGCAVLPTSAHGTLQKPSFSGQTLRPGVEQIFPPIAVCCLKIGLEGLRFLLGPAVNQSVVRIPTPRKIRVGPSHPEIERIVHEQI